MALIEVGECVFDATLLAQTHGFESLDLVAREAFVNHIHVIGEDAVIAASRIIDSWTKEMRLRWPGRTFRVYRQTEDSEVIVRFHLMRPDMPNWCELGIEIISVSP